MSSQSVGVHVPRRKETCWPAAVAVQRTYKGVKYQKYPVALT